MKKYELLYSLGLALITIGLFLIAIFISELLALFIILILIGLYSSFMALLLMIREK